MTFPLLNMVQNQGDFRPHSAGHLATLSPPQAETLQPPLRTKKMPLYLVISKICQSLRRRKTPYIPLFSLFIAVLRNNFSGN